MFDLKIKIRLCKNEWLEIIIYKYKRKTPPDEKWRRLESGLEVLLKIVLHYPHSTAGYSVGYILILAFVLDAL